MTDAFLNPNPNETVYFIVNPAGPHRRETGIRGHGRGRNRRVLYTSTESGLDTIHAFADSLDPPTGQSGQQDPGEPFDDATKLWHPGDPATLALTPKSSTNEVGTQHCVKAEVRDAFGNRSSDGVVRFDVEGASRRIRTLPTRTAPIRRTSSETPSSATGPDLPGADTIHAYADNDGDGTQNANETAKDIATKTWVLPPSTPGCEISIHTGAGS